MSSERFYCTSPGCGKSYPRQPHLTRHIKKKHAPCSFPGCVQTMDAKRVPEHLQRHVQAQQMAMAGPSATHPNRDTSNPSSSAGNAYDQGNIAQHSSALGLRPLLPSPPFSGTTNFEQGCVQQLNLPTYSVGNSNCFSSYENTSSSAGPSTTVEPSQYQGPVHYNCARTNWPQKPIDTHTQAQVPVLGSTTSWTSPHNSGNASSATQTEDESSTDMSDRDESPEPPVHDGYHPLEDDDEDVEYSTRQGKRPRLT